MNDTMLDPRQQDRNLDRALDPLDEAPRPEDEGPLPEDEAPLPDLLELAYAARMWAVLHGAASAQTRTAQEVERLEGLCIQRRQLHRLAEMANTDPSYYLG